MAINKVIRNTKNGAEILLDLTGDTATEDVVFAGSTFHAANGEVKTGSFTLENEMGAQKTLITQIKSALAGKAAGGGSDAKPTQRKTVDITSNCTTEILPDDGFVLSGVTARVNVPIPDGYIKPSGTLEVVANGTHNAKQYESVKVNVPIPDGYIVPSGTLEITENGEYDITNKESVVVAVESGGSDPKALLDAALNNTLTAIDSNVTSVVAYACRGLSKLKTVKLPNATSIGTYAFYYCTSMTRIDAPKVTTLNSYAFYNCSKLTSINFPLATSIPSNCFYSCGEITKADFGAAKSIAASAFAYCDAMNALILRRTDAICTLANTTNALKSTPIESGTGFVYVPAALIDTYRAASNWSTYAAQFRAIEDYPEICG